MRRFALLCVILLFPTACSSLDEDPKVERQRFETRTDNQFRRTTRTTTTDAFGSSVSEESSVWNKQADGSWKHAGVQRR
jgi:hypothetical protein